MSMRLNLDMPMLERLSEGVVLLNRQAKLVAHNSAAKAWTALCVEKASTLKLLIDQAAMGRVELPARLSLFAKSQADGVPGAEAWLCKDGLQDYAIFLLPHKLAGTDAAVGEKRFVSLLGEEVRARLDQLRSALQVRTSDAEVAADPLAAQCAALDSLLKEMADLSTLMQRAHPFDDERIEMDQLIQEQLPRLQEQFSNAFVFKPSGVKQGVLYGNAPWLSYALRTLLVELGDSAPPGSAVVLNMHQMGGFLVLTGDVAGHFGTAPAPLPGTTSRDTRQAADGEAHGAPMVMAKRIIDLHSGRLKINFLPQAQRAVDAGALLESFTLTLPTGVSSQQPMAGSCAECPIAKQAQLYASDMAILLAGN